MEEFFVGVSAFDFATGGTGGLQPQKCLTQGCGVVHHFFSLVFLLFSWFLPLDMMMMMMKCHHFLSVHTPVIPVFFISTTLEGNAKPVSESEVCLELFCNS